MIETVTKYRAQGVVFDTRVEAQLAEAHACLRQAGWQPSVLDQDEWLPPRPDAETPAGLSLQQMAGVLLNAAKAGGHAEISYRLAETLAAAALGVGAGLTPIPQSLRDLFARRELRGRWAPEDVVAVFEAGGGAQRVGLATLAAEAITFAQQLAAAEEVKA